MMTTQYPTGTSPTVKLKNGSEEDRAVVAVTLMSLKHLIGSDPICFYELVMHCRSADHGYEKAKDEWKGMADRYKAEPAPIVVPATGAPTCRGVALTVRPLTTWAKETDLATEDDLVRVQADRARCDGHVLCLRPTADRPALVGLSSTAFAVASLQDDFADRALVVDPGR